MIATKKEIRDHVKTACRETQIDSTINDFINLTLAEINDPAWSFEQIAGMKGYQHHWSFLRRKNSFATVASTETYQLPRDVDKISLVRQTDSPVKLLYVPDEVFYRYIPNPESTGSPLYYRLWEEEGVSTILATADTIDIVSSSASDTTETISIVGYDANGILQSEVLNLNGTTTVNGTITYVANRPLRISKSTTTVGDITVSAGGTTLVVVGQEERSPRFKKIGLYPIPADAYTIYIEYYTRLRELENDTDVPDLDQKWINIVVLGTKSKVYQYQNKEGLFTTTQALYAASVRSMVKSDIQIPDYIPTLRNINRHRVGPVEFSDEGYGSYGLTF